MPPDDERSNYRLARENLLDRLEAQPAEVHRIRGELGAEAAADEYDALLRGRRGSTSSCSGSGPTGTRPRSSRTRRRSTERERRAVAAEAKLEPFVDRVTMTMPVLASAPEVVFIVTGEDKAEAVERAFGRPADPRTPASLIRSTAGTTRVVADRAAAARLLALDKAGRLGDRCAAMPEPLESRPLLDVLTLERPEQLKALGHPLRLRVLETLGTEERRAPDEPRAREQARGRPRAPPLPRPDAPARRG